jgi:hypothetical protein
MDQSFFIKHWATEDMDKWFGKFLKPVLCDSEFKRHVDRISVFYKLQGFDKFEDLIFPKDPLITLSLIHKLMLLSTPEMLDDWSMVWSLGAQVPKAHPLNLYLHGNVTTEGHKTYALLVSKDGKVIFDFLGAWCGSVNDNKKLPLILGSGLIYTCESDTRFLEFVESFYALKNSDPPVQMKPKKIEAEKIKKPKDIKNTESQQARTEQPKQKTTVDYKYLLPTIAVLILAMAMYFVLQ